jgi:hypothetical protein
MKSHNENISAIIDLNLAKILGNSSKSTETDERVLVNDARATTIATFGDLPIEDEWINLQSKW